jgi:predicted amidohydrolase
MIHAKFIAAAHAAAVDVLVFPELSLCGYELALLRHCALRPDDGRLAPLRDMARNSAMTVVVGAALDGGADAMPAIAAFSYFPDGTHAVYRKQYLHPGEERYASTGPIGSAVEGLCGESYALAICADTSHTAHAVAARAAGASLYLASVLVSTGGYAQDSGNLQRYAAEQGMGVLMANHGGPSGGYAAAGRSAFWAPGGRLIVETPGPGSFLLVAEKQAGVWSGGLQAVFAC